MKYIVLVFLGACSYGVLSTFVKIAYDKGFTVDEVVGSQAIIGVLIVWVCALISSRMRLGRKPRPSSSSLRIKPRQAWVLMAVGTTNGITSILYYGALQHISASLAIVLLFQFTWLGVLLEAIANRKRPGSEKLFALIVLLVGTVIASGLSSSSMGELSWIGVVLGLLSAVSYTLLIWFSGKTATDIPSATRTAYMMTGAAILILIVYPPVFLGSGVLWEGLWLWGGLLALFGILIPPLFFVIGVPHIGSGLATILGAAELPVAVSMAFFVLHESVAPLQWIGVVAILLGVAIPEIMGMKRRRGQQTGGGIGS